ncbi:MAG TPA: hypothetical protein VMK16_15640 [Acidimicrobiales bacterium]|nr:hypothetical protein [Acidimicrobiales bacterium]
MGLFGGTQASVEAQVVAPIGATWRALREAIPAHPNVTGARFVDSFMRVEFKTDMSFATYGQNMTALVTPDPEGCNVEISGVAKRTSFGGRDQNRIRKIALEIFADLGARLSVTPCAEPAKDPVPPVFPVSVGEEVARLALLRARGFISSDDFDDHKRRLLSGELVIPLPDTDDALRGPRPPARAQKALRPAR